LPKNNDVYGSPIIKFRENTLLHIVKYISASISKITNKLAVTVTLWEILWK